MTVTSNPHADLFEDWLRTHPAPSLQALVAHWGGWEKIPKIAWDDFDRQNRDWEKARITRLYGHASGLREGAGAGRSTVRPMK